MNIIKHPEHPASMRFEVLYRVWDTDASGRFFVNVRWEYFKTKKEAEKFAREMPTEPFPIGRLLV